MARQKSTRVALQQRGKLLRTIELMLLTAGSAPGSLRFQEPLQLQLRARARSGVLLFSADNICTQVAVSDEQWFQMVAVGGVPFTRSCIKLG